MQAQDLVKGTTYRVSDPQGSQAMFYRAEYMGKQYLPHTMGFTVHIFNGLDNATMYALGDEDIPHHVQEMPVLPNTSGFLGVVPYTSSGHVQYLPIAQSPGNGGMYHWNFSDDTEEIEAEIIPDPVPPPPKCKGHEWVNISLMGQKFACKFCGIDQPKETK